MKPPAWQLRTLAQSLALRTYWGLQFYSNCWHVMRKVMCPLRMIVFFLSFVHSHHSRHHRIHSFSLIQEPKWFKSQFPVFNFISSFNQPFLWYLREFLRVFFVVWHIFNYCPHPSCVPQFLIAFWAHSKYSSIPESFLQCSGLLW